MWTWMRTERNRKRELSFQMTRRLPLALHFLQLCRKPTRPRPKLQASRWRKLHRVPSDKQLVYLQPLSRLRNRRLNLLRPTLINTDIAKVRSRTIRSDNNNNPRQLKPRNLSPPRYLVNRQLLPRNRTIRRTTVVRLTIITTVMVMVKMLNEPVVPLDPPLQTAMLNMPRLVPSSMPWANRKPKVVATTLLHLVYLLTLPPNTQAIRNRTRVMHILATRIPMPTVSSILNTAGPTTWPTRIIGTERIDPCLTMFDAKTVQVITIAVSNNSSRSNRSSSTTTVRIIMGTPTSRICTVSHSKGTLTSSIRRHQPTSTLLVVKPATVVRVLLSHPRLNRLRLPAPGLVVCPILSGALLLDLDRLKPWDSNSSNILAMPRILARCRDRVLRCKVGVQGLPSIVAFQVNKAAYLLHRNTRHNKHSLAILNMAAM